MVLVLFAGLASLPAGRAADVSGQNRALGRGVNVLGYDPVWKSRDSARFQTRHFQLLREAGFQHVRVNLFPFRHMDRDRGWALHEDWWRTLDWIVREATARKLMVVLDCHEFNAMADDPQGRREQFLAFWRQLSEHCAGAGDNVVFEILNEPHKKLTPELWNRFMREALAIIREGNPARTVVVGPAFWNSADHLAELDLPEADRNLVVTIHYYKPMEFTHQGAGWSGHKDKRDIAWPRDEQERAAVGRDFAKVSAWARQHDRPVYLGEFGAYDKAPMASRARYAEAVARAAESNGWSWAWWQFDSDFVLYDVKTDQWTGPILRALIPSAPSKESKP